MGSDHWLGCPDAARHTPSTTLAIARFGWISGAFIVGAASSSPTSNDAFRIEATVPPGHSGIT
jgi:hypothetical protein